jgi:PTH1 family peptidyl-tRNA hydrolase
VIILVLKKIFGRKMTSNEHELFLIAGLGNPGREYRQNRHNVGFMVANRVSEQFNIPMDKVKSKSLFGKGKFAGKEVLVVKPQTFMNLSGQALSTLVRFYKVDLSNMIVVHDDIDLPFGSLRIRASGGSAGQKGLESIIASLGTNEFPRLRVGIGRPPGRMQAADYVLQDFSEREMEELEFIKDAAVEAVQTFITAGIREAMNKFNGPVQDD